MCPTAMQRTKRRKTLRDYFVSTKATEDDKLERPGPPISAVQVLAVPGLSIVENFVTLDEQADLLRFLAAQTWRRDLSRRTMHFGGTYCHLPPPNATAEERRQIENAIITAPGIPLELAWLVDRMIVRGLYQASARPEYCIVNEYLSAHGISAHVENFRFGEPVCSLTLGCGDSMPFHELQHPYDGSVRSFRAAKAPRTGKTVDVWLPSGSLIVLMGRARYEWQHEIVKGSKRRVGPNWRRVSLTFRVDRRPEPIHGAVRNRRLDGESDGLQSHKVNQ